MMKALKFTILIIVGMQFTKLSAKEDGVNSIYTKIWIFLKDYKLRSQSSDEIYGTYWETKNIHLSFIYPNFHIFFTDYSNNSWECINNRMIQSPTQNRSITIPINSSFETGCYSQDFISISCEDGLILKEPNNQKRLLRIYSFYGDYLTIKRICEMLNKLQKDIIQQNFKLPLGFQSRSKNSVKTKVSKNNKTQYKVKTSKSGKYVQ